MQKVIVICEECGKQKDYGQYFSLSYETLDEGERAVEDLCCEGCLVRRLSLVLSNAEDVRITRSDAEAGKRVRPADTPMPIMLSGTG